jgi:hypothetical protein
MSLLGIVGDISLIAIQFLTGQRDPIMGCLLPSFEQVHRAFERVVLKSKRQLSRPGLSYLVAHPPREVDSSEYPACEVHGANVGHRRFLRELLCDLPRMDRSRRDRYAVRARQLLSH